MGTKDAFRLISEDAALKALAVIVALVALLPEMIR